MRPLKQAAHISPFFFLPLLWLVRKKRTAPIVIALSLTLLLAGCFQQYFRTNTQTKVDEATIQRLMSRMDKYFILHFKNRIAGLENLTISNDKLEGNLVSLPLEHSKYIHPQMKRANHVKGKDAKNTLMEVHLYAGTEINSDASHVSIPLSSFESMDIYEFDRKATTGNHILSWVGVIIGVSAAVGLIAFAIACNCPQVCINNNNGDYTFVSGVYSGAVYSSLERTDYLPLYDLKATNDSFKIRIKNVNDEEQFINRMQLLQVNHPANANVLVDRHGSIFSYDKPAVPLKAMINKKTEITSQLSSIDNNQYSFDGDKGEKGFSNVILTFAKPRAIEKAKLIIHGGNSPWSGYLYHSFAEMFGAGYEKWRNEKDKSDPKEMEQWQKDQALPLMVYIEKNGSWEFVDYFAHTGNTASRDMIMELDLSSIQTDQIKVKLETVYQFWNLDYVGIDFSENIKVSAVLLDPCMAAKPGGSDELRSLKTVDTQYCNLVSNEMLDLQYKPAMSSAGIPSYFFVSTGYYHNMKKYERKPQITQLMKFKNKGAFDEFSREKFRHLEDTFAGVSSK